MCKMQSEYGLDQCKELKITMCLLLLNRNVNCAHGFYFYHINHDKQKLKGFTFVNIRH